MASIGSMDWQIQSTSKRILETTDIATSGKLSMSLRLGVRRVYWPGRPAGQRDSKDGLRWSGLRHAALESQSGEKRRGRGQGSVVGGQGSVVRGQGAVVGGQGSVVSGRMR